MTSSYQNQHYPTQNRPNEHTAIYIGTPDRTLFSNKDIRSQFVSKVYTIVFVQILIATFLIGWFTLHQPTKQYFQQSGELWLYIALGVGIVVYMALICIETARRSFPTNFMLLLILTLSYGLIAAIFSARFNTITVLSAFGATAFATFAVILLAKYSPFDMTTCGCGLCILGLLHLVLSIVLMLVLVPMGYGSTGSFIIAGLGAFLVSLYMMFDLQLIMGGRSAELSPEEYILAAALLYMDIIHLFQYMLILFADRN